MQQAGQKTLFQNFDFLVFLMGDAPGINLVVYGAILILMVTFLPKGLAGILDRWKR